MAQITIADSTPRVQYTIGSSGSTGPFTIPWPYYANSDIKVYWDDTLKTETTHYTISGTAVDDGFSGGTVTLGASQSSITVTIVRDIPIARTTDFPVGPFNIDTLNKDLDKLYAIGQQLEKTNNNSLRLADSDKSGASTILPTPAANTLLSWNSDGDALEATLTTSTITAAAASGASAATSATAAAASASSASSSATSASTSATSAAASATAAASSATGWGADVIASQAQAEGGTDNTKGMTPLRTKQAIDANAGQSSNTVFYGFKKKSSDISTLELHRSTVGTGGETFTLSNYEDSILASHGATFAINASGHLIITLP